MITADIKKRQPLPQITAAVITESVILEAYQLTKSVISISHFRLKINIYGGFNNES